MAHDLIFFENRSTPKVVTKGEKFDAPEDYGKQTSRRAATEDEEKTIARGDWVRVDEKGNKGGEDGYKKTKMPGREHLVKHEDVVEDFLAHYGVKGMKWGVHNGEVGMNGTKAERKVSKQESKLAYKDWKKEVGGEKVANEIFQTASKTFAPAVKLINNDPMFKGKDLSKDRRLAREYDAVTSAVFNQHLAAASIDRTMTNTGRAMIYQFDRNLGAMRAIESQLVLEQSSASGYPDFKATMNNLGQIVELEPEIDEVVSHLETANNFLAHYGVRGMKWGVNRSKVKGALGQRTEAVGKPSKEAKATAKVHSKAKAQKSTQSLTNKQLKDAIERMRLEQQYSQMSGGIDKTSQQKAVSFIRDQVKNSGKQNISAQVNNQARSAFSFGSQQGKKSTKNTTTETSTPKNKPSQPFGFTNQSGRQ